MQKAIFLFQLNMEFSSQKVEIRADDAHKIKPIIDRIYGEQLSLEQAHALLNAENFSDPATQEYFKSAISTLFISGAFRYPMPTTIRVELVDTDVQQLFSRLSDSADEELT